MPRSLPIDQVVVMRPLEQAAPLMNALKEAGFTPVLLPMLVIHAVLLSPDRIAEVVTRIAEAHYVIMTSANVVQHLPPAVIKALQTAFVITMGRSTTEALKPYGISALFTAFPGSTSESLLAEPIFAAGHVRDKSIVILTGKESRVVLSETLVARGAELHSLICYEARKPQLDLRQHYQDWQQANQRVCFVATSLKILMHLHSLTPLDSLHWLKQQPLVVVSERIKDAALRLGFQEILVSRSPHVEGLMEAVYGLGQST